jgi:hypothetical protein
VDISSLIANALNFSKGIEIVNLIDSVEAVTEILNFKLRKAYCSSFWALIPSKYPICYHSMPQKVYFYLWGWLFDRWIYCAQGDEDRHMDLLPKLSFTVRNHRLDCYLLSWTHNYQCWCIVLSQRSLALPFLDVLSHIVLPQCSLTLPFSHIVILSWHFHSSSRTVAYRSIAAISRTVVLSQRSLALPFLAAFSRTSIALTLSF